MRVVRKPELGVAAPAAQTGSNGLPRRLLVGLYLLAGLPLGTFAELLPVYMRTQGVSLQDIGLLSGLHLIYGFKVVWGPLVDRSGRTGRWLGATGGLLALSYALLSQASPAHHVTLFALATLLMVASSSVYDVAADATFVRGLSGQSSAVEAQANAWRLSSFKFAMVAVSNGSVVVAGAYGFQSVFLVLLAVHGALLLTMPWRALPATVGRAVQFGPYFRGLVQWLRGPKVLHAFALVLSYKLVIASLLSFERTWWVDRGITLGQLGVVGAAVGLISTVCGASLGSVLAHRAGIVSMLRWGIVTQGCVALLYVALGRFDATLGLLALGLAASGGCFGLSTAALMSLITRLCRAPHAATQFAALTGTYALTRSFAGSVSGVVAEHLGYDALFCSLVLWTLPALCLLPRQRATQKAWHLLEPVASTPAVQQK